MFSHVTVGSTDLPRAAAFCDAFCDTSCDAVPAPLGLARRPVVPDAGPEAACRTAPGHALPRFHVHNPLDGEPASAGNGSMVAFDAASPVAVAAAHEAALRHGGLDEGAPGPRPRYGQGYYGACLRDPDSNKIQVVYRGGLQADRPSRSACTLLPDSHLTA
ncbi:Catechol 2,3-dioxygenase [Variovorax sp. OK605]|uniref:VOC family protein n=1 Tax=Variovorax sp. OK605 TaxID=1855317 RepID=UPI0008ECFE60|nr:VOC family protein [Variovorax sp. OK605]SFO98214.1 Catechol 2,3-dioxygenase [Variovorax sp. OK605]